MALRSQLFKGDPKLEAAAVSDPAHIIPGSKGAHVCKIQSALLKLLNPSPSIAPDELQICLYGQTTTAAVLRYKTENRIINPAYQTRPDNIVGKMTMARLDEDMRAFEAKPPAHIIITPISPQENREKAFPRLNFQMVGSNSLVAGRSSFAPLNASIFLPVFAVSSITIDPGQTAAIDIKNGAGYFIFLLEFQFTNSRSAFMLVPGINGPVNDFENKVDSLQINVRGLKFGSPILIARHPDKGEDKLVINVRDLRPTIFHPTSAHQHEPVQEPDEWNKVCEEAEKDPDLGFTLRKMAGKKSSPETITETARISLFFKQMARRHFDHYLTGLGATVNEDENIKNWIEGDSNARKVIAKRIREARRGGESNVNVMFTFEQLMYGDDDAQFSFGAIDNLEAEANFGSGTVDVWFEDTYEWHPPYSQYTKPQRCPDIGTPGAKRDTNFGHAALVQMKTRGAKDYQMRGKATFPMKIFPGL